MYMYVCTKIMATCIHGITQALSSRFAQQNSTDSHLCLYKIPQTIVHLYQSVCVVYTCIMWLREKRDSEFDSYVVLHVLLHLYNHQYWHQWSGIGYTFRCRHWTNFLNRHYVNYLGQNSSAQLDWSSKFKPRVLWVPVR